ncbi:hypothetical protein P4T37_27380 [Bacillus mobilis]|uniref:hypothetical protein n=1 Tax=Bacillus mobilis TaxID=2026190 RepID=UPI000BF4BBBA|nr:hypothetical protein [Bacillus mobilis]MED0940373.1 hypothetical protein [Bacillus mobilis]MED0997675.1 hypothetical protein [Bacillus mobilis]MED1003281.1 hypothetical protein [Bacillus mobilis]PFO74259.1 hypothetical protein COJ86_07685 [Bacillus cereus]
MFQKLKFYLMSILISAFLGGIIIGANFLVHNIYNLAAVDTPTSKAASPTPYGVTDGILE